MKPELQDVKTFITWWAMVKENSSLIQKAKQKLGTWMLQDEHFQAGTWEAVAGLAQKLIPEDATITLATSQPWLLPGLVHVLQALKDVKCVCKAEWRREWHLQSESITLGMSLLLKYSSPSTVVLELPEDQDSASFDALPSFVSHLTFSSCSVILLLEGDFLSMNSLATSDYLLLPNLNQKTRVRFRRLSCHLGIEAAEHFYQEEKYADSSEEDFPSARLPPVNPTLPVVRYLEVLKVRISSIEVITSLNASLPYLSLLEDLEVHLTLQGIVLSDDVPQITFTKDRLTLRLDNITDGRAEWAGRVAAAFSRQYANIWLCKCYMTSYGGLMFLDQLKVGRTLVGAIHVFAADASRPNGREFLTLSTQASLLSLPTSLYW